MVQSPWLKTDPQQNFHQIALNNSLLQPNLLNGLPQRYVLSQCSTMPDSNIFFRKLSPLAPPSGGSMSQPLPSLQHLATKFGLNTTQPQPVSSLPNPSLNSTLPNPIAGSSHLRSLKSNHFGPAHAFSHQINPILNSIPQSGPSDEMPKPFAHGPSTRPNPSGPGPRVPPVDGGHPNMPGPRDGPSMGGEMETDEKGECKLCNSHEKIEGIKSASGTL